MLSVHTPIPADPMVYGVAIDVIVSLVLWVLGWGLDRFNQFLSRRTNVGIPLKLGLIGVLGTAGLTAAALVDSWLLAGASALAVAVLVWRTLRGLFRLGLRDVFPTTEAGIGYSQALGLVHSSIEFLGIGASKLTAQPEFKAALERCSSSGGACRFLLSSPDSKLLERLARRYGAASAGAYKENVEASLRVLAGLSINHEMRVEVRFHPVADRSDFQQLRLMFIDDQTCLFGWAVWDSSLGRNNPQLLLRQAGSAEARKATMYKALRDYYEEMWQAASPEVDLSKYL